MLRPAPPRPRSGRAAGPSPHWTAAELGHRRPATFRSSVIRPATLLAATVAATLLAPSSPAALQDASEDAGRATATDAASAAAGAPQEAAGLTRRRDRIDAGAAAAQLGPHTISFAELDQLLLDRHALGPVAKDALDFLSQSALIDHLGGEAGITVTDEQVRARFDELDRRTREQGIEGGLRGHMERSGVDPDDFMAALRDQLVLAELTRRALGLPKGEPVPEYDQQIWLDQQMTERELQRYARPWEDGVVARLGEVEIRAADLAVRLRDTLGTTKLRDALFQLMLAKRIEGECAGVDAAVRRAAVDAEIERRRQETAANPAYQGVSLEALLKAQGLDPDRYHMDPAVRIAGLSTLLIDTRYAGARLEEAYRAEQEWFDDRYGESVRAMIIYAVATDTPDEIVKFTRETARERLREIASTLDSEPAFTATAAQLSQDATNGLTASDLGTVHRVDERLDGEISEVVFRLHEQGVRGVSEPIEMSTGVGLYYIGQHRPTPDFAGMRDAVHTELRRRLLVGLIPSEAFVTYLDPPPLAEAGADAGGEVR